jgi:hypothetical protein
MIRESTSLVLHLSSASVHRKITVSGGPENECRAQLRVLSIPKAGNRLAVENLCRAVNRPEYAGSGSVPAASRLPWGGSHALYQDRLSRVEAPAFMRGKERFSAPGGRSVPLCTLVLVAAKKRGPFMVRGSHVSYQGATLDAPNGVGKKVLFRNLFTR